MKRGEIKHSYRCALVVGTSLSVCTFRIGTASCDTLVRYAGLTSRAMGILSTSGTSCGCVWVCIESGVAGAGCCMRRNGALGICPAGQVA